MIDINLHDPQWYLAFTLLERATAFPDKRPAASGDLFDTHLAQYRWEQWRSQTPFNNETYLSERLAQDRLSRETFYYLLGETTEALHERLVSSPGWIETLNEAFVQSYDPLWSQSGLPNLQGDQGMAQLLILLSPIVTQGQLRLQKEMQRLEQAQANPPFDSKQMLHLFLPSLVSQLLPLVSRTMALELHVARLQGFLKGETSQQRFESFLQRIQQPDVALALLREYPVMARQVVNAIERWITVNLEFLDRLCQDWPELQASFDIDGDFPQLTGLSGGAGDQHRGGRSVMVAQFQNGLRLVYKPRSVAVEVHFQSLLAWLNDHGTNPPFRTLRILSKDSYGWVEFVQTEACASTEALHRFYQRQGGYLALLYCLEATDFHFENVIAAGEHPVLVDLESLFHPRLGIEQQKHLPLGDMGHSVLRVGLLPQRFQYGNGAGSVDLSGLGAAPGQLMPSQSPTWEGLGTDELRLIRKRLALMGGQNRPSLNGYDIHVLDYADDLVAGFTAVYQMLLDHRHELLSETGVLNAFAEDEIRVICRSTAMYSTLLNESFHPDVFRDALDRDRLFDNLWGRAAQMPHLKQVIPHERYDLLNGDIPHFTTRACSTDLWTSTGEIIPGYFTESGLHLVQKRLQKLSQKDLERQTWFIRASLATSATHLEQLPVSRKHIPTPSAPIKAGQIIQAAQDIGNRLEAVSFREEEIATWIGLSFIDEGAWSLVSLGPDLYSGIPGLALFLGYLGAISGETQYTQLARASLKTLERQMDGLQDSLKMIGGFSGWGGILYTFTHLGVLWHESALIDQAEEIVQFLPDLIAQDEILDVIGGAAGCIGALLSLYQAKPSPSTLAAAILCGEHLLSQAKPMRHGLGWPTQASSNKALTGFSHGVAGIAWALLRLTAVTQETRFQEAARQGLIYERSCFVPEVGNWPDLREIEGHKNDYDPFMVAWCHGASGIGLSRLAVLPYMDDPELLPEIDIALQTTRSYGLGGNHSLCHGDLGNIEFLLQANNKFDDPKLRHSVDHWTRIILTSIEAEGWLCGVPHGIETPGLMAGLAGIGYGFLRLAKPGDVPSVLLLESPRNILDG